MSHLALMANSKTPLSKQMLLNMTYEVTHVLFRQHTFSCSSCILLHTLQIHHESSPFSGSGGCDCGSLALASKSLAYSKLPRPWLSTRIRSFSLSSWDDALTKSYRTRQQQGFNYKVISTYCQPISFHQYVITRETRKFIIYLYFTLRLLYSSLMTSICTGVSIHGLDFNSPNFARFLCSTLTASCTFRVSISTRAACRPRSSLSATCCFTVANLQ